MLERNCNFLTAVLGNVQPDVVDAVLNLNVDRDGQPDVVVAAPARAEHRAQRHGIFPLAAADLAVGAGARRARVAAIAGAPVLDARVFGDKTRDAVEFDAGRGADVPARRGPPVRVPHAGSAADQGGEERRQEGREAPHHVNVIACRRAKYNHHRVR